MVERASLIGSRIRERRLMAGMKQADLAQAAGISASYLNLIEHNRRRIGGKTLNQLAEILDVSAALLAQGAEATMLSGLREAATAVPGAERDVELDRVEEFAGRFPGWAKLVTELARERDDLTQAVKTLSDRIAHDPELAHSLHEVISTVTAIRSTASILAGGALEPQWQSRFHRNINEDSERLAGEAESLVRYLEGAPGSEVAVRAPLEQVQAFLAASDHHFSELEGPGGSARVASIIDRSEHLGDVAARQIASGILEQYVQDARALPLRDMRDLIEELGMDPVRLSDATGQPLAQVARRLAALPDAIVGPVGIYVSDITGRLIVQKPVLGLDLMRGSSACSQWPLYHVLAHPGQVIQRRMQQGDVRVSVLAMSQEMRPASIDRPPVYHAQMLVVPDAGEGALWPVSASCPLCTMGLCEAE